MARYVQIERERLADALAEAGPEAPTLCEGWTARDLAAHLVIRERRPDASGGIVFKPLAGWTDHVQRRYRDGKEYSDLVGMVRKPPPWSLLELPGVAEATNLLEFFVHHEDVRRGEPGWAPRPPDAERDAEVWSIVKRMGRTLHRSSPVGVRLRTPAGRETVARPGRGVTVVGEPGELLLQAFGRAAVEVEIVGDPADVVAFGTAGRGL